MSGGGSDVITGASFKPGKDEFPKHSSGDLHSRLKTRKLLGVGETDDGDIHRSKLSQILGHSDQLYVRLPYGLRLWQLVLAAAFTITGLVALVFPSHVLTYDLIEAEGKMADLPVRLYGGAVLSLSLVHWMTLKCQDRDVLRMTLMTSMAVMTLNLLVAGVYTGVWSVCLPVVVSVMTGTIYFYAILTRDSRH